MRILAINPGASSTKIGVYEDDKALLEKVILHSAQQLSSLSGMAAARAFRRGLVLQALREAGLPLRFDAIIGRGGLLRPLSGGVYEVDEAMCTALQNAPRQHPCNLGSILAYELSQQCGCPAMMADPGVVTEMDEVSFLSGSPLIRRECFWHALNQKAVARRYARSVGKRYEDLRLIVCHMGSGISVASHCEGRAIDVNNALDGEGSFSVGRSGSLPVLPLIRLCYSGRFTEAEMEEHIMRGCGLQGYLGTSDMREVMQRVEAGDAEARLAVDAMVFQTSKEIAAQSAVLSGQVDAILITGGLAHVPYVTEGITRRVGHIAAVTIYPGEDELAALARNALAVLGGEKDLKHYTPEPWELAKANTPTESAAAGHRTRPVVAAILAGGTGLRLGAEKPKQFLEIAGKTVLEHAVDAFVQCDDVDEVIIVCHADYVERLKEQVWQTPRWKKVRDVVCGGSDRTGSSLQAIRWCDSRDVDLLLHDAARPFVPQRVISDVCRALLTAEAVNVVMPAADTILLATGDHVTSIPDRCTVRRVQTPQGFRLATIAAAYDKATKDPAFRATDDFSVVHKYLPSARYALVAGDENARKITYPADLSYFRAVTWPLNIEH
ncbi:MAG: butyrate kinase [Bacteroidaceae bacterium]|nr:butyrate kinase [Bacteroidaceae bacterium]